MARSCQILISAAAVVVAISKHDNHDAGQSDAAPDFVAAWAASLFLLGRLRGLGPIVLGRSGSPSECSAGGCVKQRAERRTQPKSTVRDTLPGRRTLGSSEILVTLSHMRSSNRIQSCPMDLLQKIRTIPTEPGVYLYKNAEGEVIYVGKAKNLRSRVASYFHEGRWEDSKTGTLVREAVDVDYIVVRNNKEALALENNLIKQRKPRFNILLRDDKTYPYVKLTLSERWPRVYVTRRLRKDGSVYYGPYFPANLAYRIVDLIHRNFLIPSCKVDLTRFHPRPCLQYYIKRCLGPCVQDLTTPETYQEAVRDVKLFLEGRPTDLARSLQQRMQQAAVAQEYERAARYRDLISTVEQLQERQRIAAAEGDDADVFGYHYENGMLAVNLFHMRGGRVVDRREFFWEDLPEIDTDPAAPW